ncbi:MAG: hypothetical protein IJT91_05800 [Clostridia bacterium]|nr:hypothetical protein [Clostridia bacterium]
MYHVWELIGLEFASGKDLYNIHSQCMFRIVDKDGKIMICDNDYYEDESVFEDKLDKVGAVLSDMKVKNVRVDPTGDMEILLEEDHRIQLFVNSTDGESEMWRLLNQDPETPHIICYPGKIERYPE